MLGFLLLARTAVQIKTVVRLHCAAILFIRSWVAAVPTLVASQKYDSKGGLMLLWTLFGALWLDLV